MERGIENMLKDSRVNVQMIPLLFVCLLIGSKGWYEGEDKALPL